MAGAQGSEAEGQAVQPKGGRDGLGWACFLLHLGFVLFAVLGWLMPWRAALIFYLCYLPLMFLQWRINAGACILNNTENLIREGRWRNPSNREEGAFIKTLVEDVTGLTPTRRQMNNVIYCFIIIFWVLGAGHLAWQSQP